MSWSETVSMFWRRHCHVLSAFAIAAFVAYGVQLFSSGTAQAMEMDSAPAATASMSVDSHSQPAIGQEMLQSKPVDTKQAPPAAPAPAAPATAPAALNGSYTVKSGDTLGKIAAANGTSVDHLKVVNGIANVHHIRVGQVIAMNGAPKTPSPAPQNVESDKQSAKRGVSIVTGRVTSGFGARWGTQHKGLDIAAPIGTPIYTPLSGNVISSGPAGGFGMWVRVKHSDGTITVYGHINRSLVSVGQKVSAGQQIAEVGNRGQSTGPHLHFEVIDPESGLKINPKPWLDERGFQYT